MADIQELCLDPDMCLCRKVESREDQRKLDKINGSLREVMIEKRIRTIEALGFSGRVGMTYGRHLLQLKWSLDCAAVQSIQAS